MGYIWFDCLRAVERNSESEKEREREKKTEEAERTLILHVVVHGNIIAFATENPQSRSSIKAA